MTLGESLRLGKPQFPHQQNGGEEMTSSNKDALRGALQSQKGPWEALLHFIPPPILRGLTSLSSPMGRWEEHSRSCVVGLPGALALHSPLVHIRWNARASRDDRSLGLSNESIPLSWI